MPTDEMLDPRNQDALKENRPEVEGKQPEIETSEDLVREVNDMGRAEIDALVDRLSDEKKEELFRAIAEKTGITGKEEDSLSVQANIQQHNDALQAARVEAGPQLDKSKDLHVEADRPYAIEKNETREEVLKEADKLFAEIKSEQISTISDYVEESRTGLNLREKENLTKEIYNGYKEGIDKNSVSDSIKEDISRLSLPLKDIELSHQNDITNILDNFKEKEKGDVTDAIINTQQKDDVAERFVSAYSELRDMLPIGKREPYTEEDLRYNAKVEKAKEEVASYIVEMQKLNDFKNDQARSAAEGLQESLLETGGTFGILNHMINKEVSKNDVSFTADSLNNSFNSDKGSELDNITLAYNKLAFVLDPRNSTSVLNEDRNKIITESTKSIIDNEALLIENSPFFSRAEKDTFRNELLEELSRTSENCNGNLDIIAEKLSTQDLRGNEKAVEYVERAQKERQKPIEEAKSKLTSIIDSRSNDKDPKDTALRDKEKAAAANELEKSFLSDSVKTTTLVIAVRNINEGKPLTENQQAIVDEANELSKLLNKVRETNKDLIKDNYPELEWDKNKLPKDEEKFKLPIGEDIGRNYSELRMLKGDKGRDAVEGLQQSLLERGFPSAILIDKLNNSVGDQFEINKLDNNQKLEIYNKDIDKNSKDPSDIKLAKEKLLVMLDPRFSKSFIDKSNVEERREYTANIRDTTQYILKHDSSLRDDPLNKQLLRNLNYACSRGKNRTDDPDFDLALVTNKMNRLELRNSDSENTAIEYIEKIKQVRLEGYARAASNLLNSFRNPNNKEDLLRAASDAEKVCLLDPARSRNLVLALRDNHNNAPLSDEQKRIVDSSSQICDLINKARGTDRSLDDYYRDLEWNGKILKNFDDRVKDESKLSETKNTNQIDTMVDELKINKSNELNEDARQFTAEIRSLSIKGIDHDTAAAVADGLQQTMLEKGYGFAVLDSILKSKMPKDDNRTPYEIFNAKISKGGNIAEFLPLAYEKLHYSLDPLYYREGKSEKAVWFASNYILNNSPELKNPSKDSRDELTARILTDLRDSVSSKQENLTIKLEEIINKLGAYDINNTANLSETIKTEKLEIMSPFLNARNDLSLALERKANISELRQCADKAEKELFNNSYLSCNLALALRNIADGKDVSELPDPQKDAYYKAENTVALVNAACGTNKQIIDYYHSVEWDKNKIDRNKETITKNREVDRIQKENYEQFVVISDKMKDSLGKISNSIYQCKLEISKAKQSTSSPYNNKSEEIARAEAAYKNLLNSASLKVTELIAFSIEYESSLPDNPQYDPLRNKLQADRKSIVRTSEDEFGLKPVIVSSNTILSSDYDRSVEFSNRCAQLEIIKREVTVRDIERVLERPSLTKKQQEEFEKISEFKKTLEYERHNMVERIRGIYSPSDLKIMDNAIKYGIPCNLSGFSHYTEMLEKANAEYKAQMESNFGELKEIYTSHLSEISRTLDRMENSNIKAFSYDSNLIVTANDLRNVQYYNILAEEEKRLSDVIYLSFGDESFLMDNARNDLGIRTIEPEIETEVKELRYSKKELQYGSVAEAKDAFYNAASSLSSGYDNCKSIAVGMLQNGIMDLSIDETLERRYENERQLNSAFQYLAAYGRLSSKDMKVATSVKSIFNPSYLRGDRDDALKPSENILNEIKKVPSKYVNVPSELDYASSEKTSTTEFIPIDSKDLDRESSDTIIKKLDAESIDKDNKREHNIKTTFAKRFSESLGLLREGKKGTAAANMLDYFADKIEDKIK